MQVAQTLQYLKRVTARTRIGPSVSDPAGIPDQVRILSELLLELELGNAAREAAEKLEHLASEMSEILEEKPRANLGEMAGPLRQAAEDVLIRVRDDAGQRTVFIVPLDGEDYAETALRDSAGHFGVDLAHPSQAPQHALDDFEEAVICYAVGRPAAAILFSLRGTEALLRQFYTEVIGVAPDRDTMGRMVNTLKLPVVGCTNSDPCVTEPLGPLTKRRNDAMHAGQRKAEEWNDDAARGVMSSCRNSIEIMWQHLTTRFAE